MIEAPSWPNAASFSLLVCRCEIVEVGECEGYVLNTRGRMLRLLDVVKGDYAYSVMFIVVGEKSCSWCFERGVRAQEGFVEIHHWLVVRSAQDDMG
jgi:hypothetical protein